jgi:hypothetical protein
VIATHYVLPQTYRLIDKDLGFVSFNAVNTEIPSAGTHDLEQIHSKHARRWRPTDKRHVPVVHVAVLVHNQEETFQTSRNV